MITNVDYPEIAVDGTTPYFAYRDRATTNGYTVRKLVGSEWTVVGTAGFSWTSTNVTNPIQLAVQGGVATVANAQFNSGIRNPLRMYDNKSGDWAPTSFLSSYATYPDVLDVYDVTYCNGTSYLAFYDYGVNQTLTYSSANSWARLGAAETGMNPIQLACYQDTVYRVMLKPDGSGLDRSQIQRFDATTNSWVYVVEPDFYKVATLESLKSDLAIDNGQLYAFVAEGELLLDTPQPTVYRLDAGAWVEVGAARFTHEMSASYTFRDAQLAVHSGHPVAAFVNHSQQPVVWHYDGVSWSELGAPGTLLQGITTPSPAFSIDIGTDGTVWAVLVDTANVRRVTVKRLTLH